MIQFQRAIVVVEGSCQNGWSHREVVEYSYNSEQDKVWGFQSAQGRAIARLQLDHLGECDHGTDCGTVKYRVKLH